MPYPDAGELAAFMVQRGIVEADGIDLDSLALAVESASQAWERDTGWFPFLAGESETRTFDGPEGRVMFLPVGLVSVSDLSVGGSAYTAGESYFLQHRVGSSGPYTAIEFGGYLTGARRVIEITGVFGYTSELPADVKQAIMSKAASDVLDMAAAGPVVRETVGPVTYQYGDKGRLDRLNKVYAEAVARYKRWM